MSGYRPEYTHDEEKKIVDYIVENKSIYLIKGDRLWRDIEESGIVDRTWQSLKQHFRKQMIHQLHYERYELDEQTLANFREVFNKPTLKNSKKSKSTTSKEQAKSKVNTDKSATAEDQERSNVDTDKRRVANILELDSSSDESN